MSASKLDPVFQAKIELVQTANPQMSYSEVVIEAGSQVIGQLFEDLNTKPVRVVVELDDVGVATAYANRPVELIVIDQDPRNSDNVIELGGGLVEAHVIDVEVDPEACDEVFRIVGEQDDSDLDVPEENTSSGI